MSREASLVTAEWVEEHLDDSSIVLIEVDEDTTSYDKGHIRGAIKLDWTTDLQDQVRRDFVNKEQFEALLSDRGVANDSPDGRSAECRWRERGLDRLVHRVVSIDPDGPVARVRTGAAGSARTVDVTYRWTVADEVALRVEVVPSPDWDCTWPRVGVRFDLPATLRRAHWFGTGPHESYPDSARAARVGRFEAGLDELNVRYSRPQETGHRPQLRTLEIADDERVRLRLRTLPGPGGHRPGFTLTPHMPHELDRAPHPHELPAPTRTYLFLDDAVHGLGSAACGVDVAPQHSLWPGARAFTVMFAAP